MRKSEYLALADMMQSATTDGVVMNSTAERRRDNKASFPAWMLVYSYFAVMHHIFTFKAHSPWQQKIEKV